jgi:hypothetical protein
LSQAFLWPIRVAPPVIRFQRTAAAVCAKIAAAIFYCTFARRELLRPTARHPQILAAIPSLNLLTVQPFIALIFGILILLMPRILNVLVAIYLIIIGVSGLWPQVFH